MASIIKVDELQNTAGQPLLVNGYPRQPGQIIEVLSSVCDGSSVTVGSGTYTFQNVTTQQGYVGTTFTDINGSLMSYTPPAGTTRVMYRFTFGTYWVGVHAINGYRFLIDGAEVVFSRHSRSAQYNEDRYAFEWTIAIGGTPNANTGRQGAWTSAKALKLQYNQYGASNYNNLHGTAYWNGTNSNQFNIPILTITAIA
jgi:hypothetical protein